MTNLLGKYPMFYFKYQLSINDVPQGIDVAPRQSLQNFLSNQGCTFAERLSDLFAQNQILIVHGVKGDGPELAHIHLAVLPQYGFVSRHIDDPPHQAAGFGVVGNHLALQRHGQLVDKGRVHKFGLRCVETGLGKLVRLFMPGHEIHVVTGCHIIGSRHGYRERLTGNGLDYQPRLRTGSKAGAFLIS